MNIYKRYIDLLMPNKFIGLSLTVTSLNVKPSITGTDTKHFRSHLSLSKFRRKTKYIL